MYTCTLVQCTMYNVHMYTCTMYTLWPQKVQTLVSVSILLSCQSLEMQLQLLTILGKCISADKKISPVMPQNNLTNIIFTGSLVQKSHSCSLFIVEFNVAPVLSLKSFTPSYHLAKLLPVISLSSGSGFKKNISFCFTCIDSIHESHESNDFPNE